MLLLKSVTVGGKRHSGRGTAAKILSVIVTCFAERLLKKRENLPDEVEIVVYICKVTCYQCMAVVGGGYNCI